MDPPVNPLGPADSGLETWRLVLAALVFGITLVLGLALVLVRPSDPDETSPSPSAVAAYSPTGKTDQPPSMVMVWPVTASASAESR